MVLKVSHMAPKETHQLSKGPQANDGKLGGDRNFAA